MTLFPTSVISDEVIKLAMILKAQLLKKPLTVECLRQHQRPNWIPQLWIMPGKCIGLINAVCSSLSMHFQCDKIQHPESDEDWVSEWRLGIGGIHLKAWGLIPVRDMKYARAVVLSSNGWLFALIQRLKDTESCIAADKDDLDGIHQSHS